MRYPGEVLQVREPYKTLTVRTQAQGAPTTDGQGTDMTQFNHPINPVQRRPKRFLIRVDVSNVGTSCKLTLWAKDSLVSGTGKWGVPVDPSGNFGVLAANTALPVNASYYFVFEDLGFDEVCLVQGTNVGGTPVCTAQIAEFREYAELR